MTQLKRYLAVSMLFSALAFTVSCTKKPTKEEYIAQLDKVCTEIKKDFKKGDFYEKMLLFYAQIAFAQTDSKKVDKEELALIKQLQNLISSSVERLNKVTRPADDKDLNTLLDSWKTVENMYSGLVKNFENYIENPTEEAKKENMVKSNKMNIEMMGINKKASEAAKKYGFKVCGGFSSD